MSWLSFFGRLYSLDTLDTRFTSSAKTPHKVAAETPVAEGKLPAQTTLQAGSNEKVLRAQPSLWNTTEFYLYYLCFLTIPVFMVKAVYDVSKGTIILYGFHDIC